MELIINRTVQKKVKPYTEGRLSVNGQYICDTLEPQWRNLGAALGRRKVVGKSAIPDGRYAVAITLSPRFQRWLPLLLHVPHFTGIRIHEGNDLTDTHGCILVGRKSHPGMLIDSRFWLARLLEKLDGRPEGEPIWITIRSQIEKG